MNDEYLAKTLKRIYDECQQAQGSDNDQSVGKALISDFNDLLGKYQNGYPDNDIIQEIDPVTTSGWNGGAHPQDVQKIKLNTLKIADILGLDTEDFQQPSSSSDSLATINIQQQQDVSQSVTVNNLLKQVDNRMMSELDKEELKEVIREYEAELESGDPDKSTLDDLHDKARGYSTDIALKLGMRALERGIDVLI